MWTPFDTRTSEPGYRLHTMEIYNWGTFHQQIFRISPKGNNSLLTGANGSGKTTFIDALLTLLVPLSRYRFYNQSSGVLKKGDRTEESYILGHYGDIQKEGDFNTTTQQLRSKRDFCVLRATFAHTNGKVVTLFQVKAFGKGNEKPKTDFGVAQFELDIQTINNALRTEGSWKNHLKQIPATQAEKVEFFAAVGAYADRIINLFGFRDDKALGLFNQLVGIKVLGDLDGFIREQMLEKKDIEGQYQKLHHSFQTLMEAKNKIDKTNQQIIYLKPIHELAITLTTINEKLTQLKHTQSLAVYWFTQKEEELCHQRIIYHEEQTVTIEQDLQQITDRRTTLGQRKEEIKLQIRDDENGRLLEDLRKQRTQLENDKKQRRVKRDQYNVLLKLLHWPQDPSKEIFREYQNKAKQEDERCAITQDQQQNERQVKQFKQQQLAKDIVEADNLIQTLKRNQNNMPGEVARIRQELLDHLGVNKQILPFVGELIQVKSEAKEWEGVIEKVLHGFAISLIVPEEYYQSVNQYVNRTNLKGKIVYYRPQMKTSSFSANHSQNGQTLLDKIDLRSKHPQITWVQQELTRRFNFVCADDWDEFHQAKKALMKEGLVKYGGGRHEKDDRAKVNNRAYYVLGWDNQEKIKVWKGKLLEMKKEHQELIEKVAQLQRLLKQLEEERNGYFKLQEIYTNFTEIDWQTLAWEIEDVTQQIKKLEATSDALKILKDQLDEVEQQLKSCENERDEIVILRNNNERLLEEARQRLQVSESRLDALPKLSVDIVTFEQVHHKQLANITYETFDSTMNNFQRKIEREIAKEEGDERKLERKVRDRMNNFRNPPAEILDKYKDWRSDISEFLTENQDSVDEMGEFQKMYETLLKEGLPAFEKRFDEHITHDYVNKVGNFNQFIDNWEQEIKENIQALNEALQTIDYESSPQTIYIQLVHQRNPSQLVQEFEGLLSQAISNIRVVNASEDAKKHHFEHNIKPLIKQLEDQKWRSKVLDVRAWFRYTVEEFNRDNHEKTYTHKSMGHLSGGQKAKLTYTILGAAIAYQFRLTEPDAQNRWFRFIAVDEAFKALDEKNAKFLLKLCRKLNLQLMMVTPSDNIHIVENDISFIHLVKKNENQTSYLYDLPIEQFKEQRAIYQEQIEQA